MVGDQRVLSQLVFPFVIEAIAVGVVVRSAGEVAEHAVLEPVHYAVGIGIRGFLKVMGLVGGGLRYGGGDLGEGASVGGRHADVVHRPVPEGVSIGGQGRGDAGKVRPRFHRVGLRNETRRLRGLRDLYQLGPQGKGAEAKEGHTREGLPSGLPAWLCHPLERLVHCVVPCPRLRKNGSDLFVGLEEYGASYV